jgi:hypothetical protein
MRLSAWFTPSGAKVFIELEIIVLMGRNSYFEVRK